MNDETKKLAEAAVAAHDALLEVTRGARAARDEIEREADRAFHEARRPFVAAANEARAAYERALAVEHGIKLGETKVRSLSVYSSKSRLFLAARVSIGYDGIDLCGPELKSDGTPRADGRVVRAYAGKWEIVG